ncbi:snRNA-activating protein complex subunit 5-like [Mytilus edulis]|uniref:snRNA-activating protein complex subunit 5-like n=1 Tax=Mytilus edulis TaxID=6550 RepID=UPI0039F1284F
MTELRELKRLKDEERTLISLASLLTDQLNRLKVEELALLSKRRLQTTSANSQLTISSRHDQNGSRTEQEMFLAEEMVDYSATNEVHQPSEQYNQDLPQIVSIQSGDQVIAINEGHMILPEDHVMEVSNHVTSTNSHVIDAPDHVVQLDLAVSSHQQGSGREVQEEEEDEDD